MNRYVIALASLSFVAAGQAQTVHIPDTEGDVNFGTYITAALVKWKVPLRIVSSPENADYTLGSSGSTRKSKWHEGWITKRGESASAVVELLDRCGTVVWGAAAGDRSLRMDTLVGPFSKRGPKKVADRIARRLRTALKNGDVPKPPEACP